jgi:hypothetical protein
MKWNVHRVAPMGLIFIFLVYGIGLFSFLLVAYLGVRRLGGARGPGDASPM